MEGRSAAFAFGGEFQLIGGVDLDSEVVIEADYGVERRLHCRDQIGAGFVRSVLEGEGVSYPVDRDVQGVVAGVDEDVFAQGGVSSLEGCC